MERNRRNNQSRETTAIVRDYFFNEFSRKDYGWIPLVGGVLSKLHSRWAASEYIRLRGQETIRKTDLVNPRYL